MRRLLFIDRALPYLGPAFALVLGVVGLGRRSLDVDEASVGAAAHGSVSPWSAGTTQRNGSGSPRSSPP